MGLGKTYSTKYLLDSNNSSGVAGQVLSTTSTGIDWVDANTVPGAGLWLENGNDIYNSNSGNVGIGTTSPDAQLSIYKTAFGGDTAGSGGTLDFGVGSTKYWQFRLDSSSSGDLAIDKTYANVWTTPVTIQRSSGNVGIGTTSPLTTLHVNKSSDAQVLVQGTNKMALHQDAAWNSNILLGCYYDGSNIVYGSTNRGAFKIVGLHDSTTQPQTLSIYGANGASPAGSTVTFNSVGFSQDEDGNVGIGTLWHVAREV